MTIMPQQQGKRKALAGSVPRVLFEFLALRQSTKYAPMLLFWGTDGISRD